MTEAVYRFVRLLESLSTPLIMYGFLNAMFLRRSENRGTNGAKLLIFSLLIIGLNSFNYAILNLCGGLLVLTLAAVSLFRISLRNAFLYLIVYMILMVNVELIAVFLSPVLGVEAVEATLPEILILLAEIMTKIFVIEVVKKQVRSVDTERENSCMGFLSLLSTAIFALLIGGVYPLTRADKGNLYMLCSSVLFILTILVGFSMVEKMAEAVRNQQNSLLTAQRAELSQNHYRKMEELTREYGAYVHELEHNLRTIRQLWENGSDGAADQLAASAGCLGQHFRHRLYLSDPIVNAILMEGKKNCMEQGLQYDVSLLPGLNFDFIHDIDKISMFGNMLDNAIEAALLTENGFVNVSLFMGNKSMLVFKVENSCCAVLVNHNDRYATSKSDKKSHGYGIKKMRELALKYNGILDIKQEDGLFTASLILSTIQKTAN